MNKLFCGHMLYDWEFLHWIVNLKKCNIRYKYWLDAVVWGVVCGFMWVFLYVVKDNDYNFHYLLIDPSKINSFSQNSISSYDLYIQLKWLINDYLSLIHSITLFLFTFLCMDVIFYKIFKSTTVKLRHLDVA